MKKRKIWVSDTETNFLPIDIALGKIPKFWCAGLIDPISKEERWFRPHQFKEYLLALNEAEIVVFHNAFGYDKFAIEVLKEKYGLTIPQDFKYVCSKVLSQVLNFTRFGGSHSLKSWGIFFGNFKGDYTGGFEEFNENMFVYMKQDVRLGTDVYIYLRNELSSWVNRNGPDIIRAIELENRMEEIMRIQSQNGWLFDVEGSKVIQKEIADEMSKMETYINSLLGKKTVCPDASVNVMKKALEEKDKEKIKANIEKTAKPVKITGAGKYHAHIAAWFKLSPEESKVAIKPKKDWPVWGGYCRVEFEDCDIGNTDDVKDYLYSIGWKPDEWNTVKDPKTKKFRRTSPKLTESSLEALGQTGEYLNEYYTLRARQSIMNGWGPFIDKDSRLHGDVFNIGTPTFRQTHKVIANLPSAKAKFGPEIRGLFKAREGYTLVSADSAACQLRLLAYYMKDKDFEFEVLEGDVHQKNADLLSSASGIAIARSTAKPFIFAFLYGAGGPKLASILKTNQKKGNALKTKFTESYPKLKALISDTQDDVETSGIIVGLDGRPVMCDSTHKALNYLIQSAEGIIMKQTIVDIYDRFIEERIDAYILLFYHDEVTFEVREDQAEKAKEIMMECFASAPKKHGIPFMTCGDCKIGEDYYAVH